MNEEFNLLWKCKKKSGGGRSGPAGDGRLEGWGLVKGAGW